MGDYEFKKGTKVEVSIEEEGFRGAWFQATVLKPPQTKPNNKKLIYIQYETLLAENNKDPLREEVDLVNIRPVPPREGPTRVFKLDEDVDVSYNEGWWEGVVTKVHDGDEGGKVYSVYFRPSREQSEFKGEDIRLHREWVYGKWVPPLEDDDVEIMQPTKKVKADDETEVTTFNSGSLVEVSSDEDGFQGAWFAATVVEVIGKDKFLVEYRDLKEEDDTRFIREEVDALHIRPPPPDAGDDPFLLYEEVDALHNDGWWVGIISKVVNPSKYSVYFKSSDEELEFKHGDLRRHQDWIDKKWVRASEALYLSH